MSKFNSGQKLLQFQFRQFGRIPHKFADKNEVLSMFTPKFSHPSFFAQIGWNFYQMTTTCRETKLRSFFGKFWELRILYRLFQIRNLPLIKMFRIGISNFFFFVFWKCKKSKTKDQKKQQQQTKKKIVLSESDFKK